MKNAQAKIDALLDVLVENLQDEIATAGSPTDAHLARLKELILLSNLNNAKQSKEPSAPGPQSKVPEISNEKLIEDLKKTRPDNFPRRGPRNGKRENVAPPVPIAPEPPFCAIHTGVICEVVPGISTAQGGGVAQCPECAKESPTHGFVSLKALL